MDQGNETKEKKENELLRLERQKVALEVRLKRRELAGRRRGWREILSNPLMLAIVGGFISIMTSIITTAVNAYFDRAKAAQTAELDREKLAETARENRAAEERRAALARESASEAQQAELIKKFVEGPSVQRIQQNLTFLADAGLIPSYAVRIRRYLAEHPGSAPQLPASGSVAGITRPEGIPVAALPQSDVLRRIGASVGRVRGRGTMCSGFLLNPDRVLTLGQCANGGDDATFELEGRRIPAHVTITSFANMEKASFAVLRLEAEAGAPGLPLSRRPPVVGEPLSVVYFGLSPSQIAVRSRECQVTSVRAETFEYGCRTGGGSAGSPILTSDGKVVLGLHAGSNDANKRGMASRADVIGARLLSNGEP